MTTHTLTTLQYSQDRRGPWKLYIYDHSGQYHREGVWFAKTVRYPGEEISVPRAEGLVNAAMAEGREVRICDGGDELVFHAKGSEVLFGENFFKEIAT